MKILVTGNRGFIGKNLCSLMDRKGLEYVGFEGDLADKESYPDGPFDAVIHLAALITHTKKWSEEEMKLINIEAVSRICNKYKGSKIILISTTDVSRKVLSFYAKTKLEAEKIVMGKTRKNLIIRLPSIFGPNQKQDKLIPRLIKHYFLGQECILNNNELREYLFIEDATEKIIEYMNKTGIITLKGIRIKNLRLEFLIKNIYEEKIPELTFQEKKLFLQLKKCCEPYENKGK